MNLPKGFRYKLDAQGLQVIGGHGPPAPTRIVRVILGETPPRLPFEKESPQMPLRTRFDIALASAISCAITTVVLAILTLYATWNDAPSGAIGFLVVSALVTTCLTIWATVVAFDNAQAASTSSVHGHAAHLGDGDTGHPEE